MGRNDKKKDKNTLLGVESVAEAQSFYLSFPCYVPGPVDGDVDVAITGRNDKKMTKTTCQEQKQ